ncbi:hypothetical protein SAMN05421783_10525 [Thiocapsa roseopersicina]|uniref:Uncharacterized protein n=1 Tax=Thiocapsa roseopersicina TaxID=1058 RepID=A0A1H2U9H5_THIRO|nr:hypothetical protein SAMN05421783_10525 [Thiocapsa roseopersicina]
MGERVCSSVLMRLHEQREMGFASLYPSYGAALVLTGKMGFASLYPSYALTIGLEVVSVLFDLGDGE